AEALRKARTRNRRTMRRVSERGDLTIRSTFGPAELAFNFVSPAQADDTRLFELARLQLVGFFYLMTYDEEKQHGLHWPGVFAPFVVARKPDWGNPLLAWLDRSTLAWDDCLHAVAAEGFYKLWVRRHVTDAPIWAWVIEWNQGFRLGGFFGDEARIRATLANAPTLDWTTVHDAPERRLRMRREIPLSDDHDKLFDWSER